MNYGVMGEGLAGNKFGILVSAQIVAFHMAMVNYSPLPEREAHIGAQSLKS